MIEATITDWIGSLTVPLYPVAIPDNKKAPGIVYRVESEFTPSDGHAPYGAFGYRVRVSIWHASYKSASEIATEVRDALNASHPGYLISVEDRGDYQDGDTGLYGIVLDVEITALKSVIEAVQTGLRGAVKTLLSGNTDAAANVFATRIGFANCDQFPCIGVSLQDIDIESGNADQKRRAELEINIKTRSSIDSENELEVLTGQAESQLHPDTQPIADSVLDLARINTSYSAVGRLHFEHRVMTFNVEYYTAIPDSTDVVPLNTVAADYNIDQDSDPEAQDLLTIPQD